MKLSVVMVTSNRAHLLKRSLYSYLDIYNSGFEFELVIVDDDSKDETESLCRYQAKHMPVKYIKVEKPEGVAWRDCAVNINLGIREAAGEVVVCTHPEVIPGDDALQLHYRHRQPMRCISSKIYYLTPRDQELLDTVRWDLSSLEVRNIPCFYDNDPNIVGGNAAYGHAQMDQNTDWGSWVFMSCLKETWKYAGGFAEQNEWGTVDMDWLTRRSMLGIETLTLMEPRSICIHQNHDILDPNNPHYTLTPRDMSAAERAGRTYATPEEARLGHI